MYPTLKSVRTVYFHTALLTCFVCLAVGVGQYPPPLFVPNQAPPGVSDFADGSGHIFSMYLEMATEEDKKMVEDWKADADGILIFVRLSSNLVLHADSLLIGHRLVFSLLLSQR